SRRRHTRFSRDWSSDVCSSDLQHRMNKKGRLIAVTAPSGSGKTTIVKHILETFPETAFSVSATTREKRSHEVHGKDYYYLSLERSEERRVGKEDTSWVSRLQRT